MAVTADLMAEFEYPVELDPVYKKYIDDRVIAQIDWYDKKSIEYQKNFKRYSKWAIILNAAIPVATLLADTSAGLWVRVGIAIASSAAAVLTSLVTLHSFKELWLRYRLNCEMMKSALHKFYAKAGAYNTDFNSAFLLLVKDCENYLTDEFKQWGGHQEDDQSSKGS